VRVGECGRLFGTGRFDGALAAAPPDKTTKTSFVVLSGRLWKKQASAQPVKDMDTVRIGLKTEREKPSVHMGRGLFFYK